MIGRRSTWIAARARNAARRGLWIAAFGGLAVIVTLLALVMVPREVDKQLRRRIAALPAVPDSIPIALRLESLHAQLAAMQVISRAAVVDSTGTDSLADVARHLRRVRQVPSADGYRTLANSPLLRSEPIVLAILDSIDVVEREREAHAALGGPGARYAALTARLAVLGQGLVRLADARLANTIYASANAPDSTGAIALSVALDSTRRDSLTRRIAIDELQLTTARQRIAARDTQQARLEARLNVVSPPIAMLLAALVVGLAVGYGVVLSRELRRPTVGDAAEVERLTSAPVLPHTRDTPSTLVERTRLRERPGVPRIIDRDSDSFALLHLALTGVGDVVTHVEVLSDTPLIAAAVALGTAAAAARESRAVLIIEATRHQPLLAHVLYAKARYTLEDVHSGLVSAEDAVHVLTLDRDARIDVLLAAVPIGPPAGLFRRRQAPAVPTVRPPSRALITPNGSPAIEATPAETLRRFESHYDLRLTLPDADDASAPIVRDVVLCVRQGSTPLAWLTRTMAQVRMRQQRVRAVVLWSRDVPEV